MGQPQRRAFLRTPFGGHKGSGLGREESIEEYESSSSRPRSSTSCSVITDRTHLPRLPSVSVNVNCFRQHRFDGCQGVAHMQRWRGVGALAASRSRVSSQHGVEVSSHTSATHGPPSAPAPRLQARRRVLRPQRPGRRPARGGSAPARRSRPRASLFDDSTRCVGAPPTSLHRNALLRSSSSRKYDCR